MLVATFFTIATPSIAGAQMAAVKVDKLLAKGWEPFSAQYVPKFTFITDASGHTIAIPAYTLFCAKKWACVLRARYSWVGLWLL